MRRLACNSIDLAQMPAPARPVPAAERIPAARQFWGNQAALRLSRTSPRIQPKLEVGAANDPLEAEADRAADQVMRMPDAGAAAHVSGGSSSGTVRRMCAECQEEEEEKMPNVQRKARTGGAAGMAAPPIVSNVLSGPGQPLDRAARSYFEPRMGFDLDAVRVHTGRQAAASAGAVDALAYTSGHNIVFGEGQYQPSSQAGRRLLAHELAHVAQQTEQSGSAADPTLRRAPRPGHCNAVWSCSGGSACNTPDVAGSGQPSTSWQLDVNIDTDVESASDITSADDIGHTYVLFSESNGAQYTYGFYPTHSQIPDPVLNPIVWGCMVHPDTDHKSCVDYTKTYKLTKQQYDQALHYAQSLCVAPPKYDLFKWNCTTAAVEIAKQAGQSAPSPRGKIDYTKEADNPNTLKEGYLDMDTPTRHLSSDSDIRDWVSKHTVADFLKIATAEKARLLNRLLEGWISDDDVVAFESICKGITGPAERTALLTATQSHVNDMNSTAQQNRVRAALGSPSIAAPAPVVNVPTPPPPR